MADVPFLLMGMDLVACTLTLMLVGLFIIERGRSREPFPHLVAAGFALVAGSFLAVSASTFDVGGPAGAIDAARLAGQTGGALAICLAMLGRRAGRGFAAYALGWLVVAASVVGAAVYALLPARDASLPLEGAFVPAHLVQTLAYAVCTALSVGGLQGRRAVERVLVPFGFLAWTLSKYTWLLIDLSGALGLVPFVYLWRFTALASLLVAFFPVSSEEPAGASA